MEYREVGVLPERRWGSSEIKHQKPHGILTVRGHWGDPEGNAKAAVRHPSRPLSSIPSWPESARGSQPNSRPLSRLGPATEQGLGERPRSGRVRPLSARVFMRRTSQRGWVAKAYPDPPSLTELDIEDDLSTSSSTDSFFDDDFDTCHQEEKLQNLLTCNTLGVESKGRRPDWNAGEVDIPRFHCPRCRDHWYGLTPFPCDEELARLIREGLWYTGEKGNAKLLKEETKSTRRRSASVKDEFKSLSSGSLPLNLKNKRKTLRAQNSRDNFETWQGAVDPAKKKGKKHITFKLDAEDGSNSDRKSGLLDSGDGSGQSRASTGLIDSGSSNLESGGGLLKSIGSGGGASTGLGEEEDKLNTARPSTKSRGSHFGAHSEGQSGDSDGSGVDTGGTSGNRHLKGGKMKDGKDGFGEGTNSTGMFGKDHLGARNLKNRKIENGSGRSNSDGSTNLNIDGSTSSGLGTGSGKWASHSGSATSSSMDSQRQVGGVSDGFGRNVHHTSSQQGSLTNLSSSSKVQRSGDHKGALGREDHGKNVRKAVSYMRAVSPTHSDWGDPMHARSYISSTVTSSQTGSTSNLLRDKEGERTLPPIVPPIRKKDPMTDLSSMMAGIQFTRAWTFSYHNAGSH